jgi:hypothetical protein
MKYIKKFNESKVQKFGYDIISEEPIENLEKYKDHRRLKVFYEKGIKCCECGIEATKIVHGRDRRGNIHIDICTDDYFPLTIDHILPKSKGGSNYINNLRTMCSDCNEKRGNDETIPHKGNEIGNIDRTPIKVGDIVYNKNTYELMGEVEEILENPYHPNRALGCRIKEKDKKSIYNIKSLYKKLV